MQKSDDIGVKKENPNFSSFSDSQKVNFLFIPLIYLHLSTTQGVCSSQCIKSSYPELFLGKGILKICSKFTGEHPCRSAISVKLQSKFIEITLQHGCSPVNLLHIFRIPFPKNTSGWLLLMLIRQIDVKAHRHQIKSYRYNLRLDLFAIFILPLTILYTNFYCLFYLVYLIEQNGLLYLVNLR